MTPARHDHGCPEFRCTAPSRRTLLRAGALGIAGLHLPALLRAQTQATPGSSPRAQSIIFLNQFGGPSHLDTFDLKPNAPANIRGDFHPIPTSVPGVQITE